MQNRYNIAFLPINNSEIVTTLANKFNHIYDRYILGDYSLPHVTVCQFIANEHALLGIWKRVCKALDQKEIYLIFNEFSCTKSSSKEIFWISLLPDNRNILWKMNVIVADIIKNPVSKSYVEYDPHMTLVNTKNKNCNEMVEIIKKNYKPIKDKFVLSLGKSDNIGQYTEIIYQYNY